MKKVYLLLLTLGSATVVFGQKMEYSAQLNSGLSRFGGESATRSTMMLVHGSRQEFVHTSNPYGSRYNATYGASLQGQYVTARGFLLGAQVGYEQLRSRANIDRIYGLADYSSSITTPADGKAVIVANNINVQPYLGWRIMHGVLDLDLTVGSDIALNHRQVEKSEATTEDGTEFKIKQEYGILHTDFRPRLGLTGYKGHFGASLSYAHGLRNHRANMDGANMKLYTQVLRIGLLYRL
ncbi:hypothetical protein K3G39_00180 [Pontibacter sp. HSC-14F20]|uniref:hypothetical protein n=1 Tax=Pontibacter sp. HSC-14F20 TaxID=2864136 RepID=UPI001C733581|nr:hypothetical protein [Pontibacter sp. HSC-14F20]MBX0331645.1 hypothetical protein [Pontibacter sp. HSC-14F20]